MDRVAFLMAVLMGGGCASNATPQGRANAPELPPTPALAPEPASATRGACPLVTRGTNMGTQDIERGSALVFTTSDDIAGLRASVTQLAALGAPPNAETHFDNVHGGVRVIFEAAPADVSGVRREIHERGRALAERCGLALGVIQLQAETAKDAQAAEPAPLVEPLGTVSEKDVPPPLPNSAKPGGKAPKKDAANPAASANPAAPAKPSEGEKPKDGSTPEEPEKPKDGAKPKEPEKPKPPPKPPWRLGK